MAARTEHLPSYPCAICGGHAKLRTGQGIRCSGFETEGYSYCSREELAGNLEPDPKLERTLYRHKLEGGCRCGTTHREESPGASTWRAAPARDDLERERERREVARYPYCDESGTLLYEVVRFDPKGFSQQRPGGEWGLGDVRRVLYRFAAVLAAVDAGDRVYIAEGEKDADRLWEAGEVATSSSHWRAEFASAFDGATVTIVQDADDPGRKKARAVRDDLAGHAHSVAIVEAREGNDASDHLDAGYEPREFVPIEPGPTREKSARDWMRALVLSSLEIGETLWVAEERSENLPPYAVGVNSSSYIPPFCGLSIIAGPPGSGKSYVALATAKKAALVGWDVKYVNAEMTDAGIYNRIGRSRPEGLEIYSVGFGVSVEKLAQAIASTVTGEKTLVVLDSVSSFVDQAATDDSDDVHRIGPLKLLTMWAMNLVRDTEGLISFLLVSETNAAGGTKGRFGDYKADVVVSLEPDKDAPDLKNLIFRKNRHGANPGDVGLFRLDSFNGILVSDSSKRDEPVEDHY